MKSIIIIYFYLLLLTIVECALDKAKKYSAVRTLNQMATEKGRIHGIFQPSEKGYLDYGGHGFAHKGLLIPINEEVAMKFTESAETGEFEYRMYTYLNAINKPNVEAYGVPCIYYYGTWNDYVIMAMTLLDSEFRDNFGQRELNKIDFLITFREIVRITKYIHGRGVFQRDVHYFNILFHKHQGFIYDFNAAESLPNDASDYYIQHWVQYDLRQFLDVMFSYIQDHKPVWSWVGCSDKNYDDVQRMKDIHTFTFIGAEDSEENEPHKMNGLRKVFIEFAKYAYGYDGNIYTTPFYDLLYERIVGEIREWEQQHNEPAVLSWLSEEDKHAAMLARDTIPSISNIRHPFASDRLEYDAVNFTYFSGIYRDQITSASGSGNPGSGTGDH